MPTFEELLMKTVLIIDDEWSIREVATLMLERAGYSALSAATAEDGLAMMAANRVSAALVDVVLPGKNGLELALELNQKWPGVPIILMSGRVSTEADSIRNFSGHFGIKGSISKPFTPEQLVAALEEALSA
jgi:DNA-binding response OmpR family regulator